MSFQKELPESLGGVVEGTNAYVINQYLKNTDKVLIIEKDIHAVNQLVHELSSFCPNRKIACFPDREILPYDTFSPPPDLVSKRLSLMGDSMPEIMVISANTLMHYLPPSDWINGERFQFTVGDRLNTMHFSEQLDRAGYTRTATVNEARQYSSRGSIFDVFPMGSSVPYRFDFFDYEIESIRSFNPESQRTLKNVDSIDLLPSNEFSLTSETIEKFRKSFRQLGINSAHSTIYQKISSGKEFPGIEFFLPWLHTSTLCSFFDYLPEETQVIICPSALASGKIFWNQCLQRHKTRQDLSQPCVPPEELFINPKLLKDLLSKKNPLYLQRARLNLQLNSLNTDLRPLNSSMSEGFKSVLNAHKLQPKQIVCCLEGKRHLEQCQQQLGKLNIVTQIVESWSKALDMSLAENGVALTVLPIHRGFFDTANKRVIFSQFEIFGSEAIPQVHIDVTKKSAQIDFQTALHNISQLTIGSPVVHLEQGVGRYNGLQTINTGDCEQDFICVLYADSDKLFVPIHDIDIISPYIGDADLAPLHKLGTAKWSKEKQKAQKKIEDVAAQLLEVYAKRATREGKSIDISDEYASFASEFPFAETLDQTKVIGEVLSDLANAKPMDRLVCGDVGFGKTEVAIRAAFVSAFARYQVGVLVPTTLLANQHLQTFKDRFTNWPVRIGIVSRMQSNLENKQTLLALEKGQIDILIGTHRLIQDDVRFNNLGLIIIDEEHRFGVKQKDRFKQLRAEVNVLAMTATPIPRTLNMAFSNLRDISIIASPPPNRVSINTFVRDWDNATIKEAISREIYRGGQVFFIHNDIATIEKMRRQILQLLPDISVGIAHGQMPERQIEAVMNAFYHQSQHVLLCTTIIETGIDIPNANTIIINRADKFGLAQLHQLRGRVGRSFHQAYAYLFVPSTTTLKGDARRRLEAISEATDLGAGFQIAIQDLEIRGSGELLGDQQKGHLQQIGFNLYMEMLERTITQMSDKDLQKDTPPQAKPCEIQLGTSALIPSEYIYDVPTRLQFYQRINHASENLHLEDIRNELLDRFGSLPESCQQLLEITQVKLQAQVIGVEKIDVDSSQIRLLFTEHAKINHQKLIHRLQNNPKQWRMRTPQTLQINVETNTVEERKQFLFEVFSELKSSPETA